MYTCLWRITSPTIAMAIGYGTTTLIGLTINKKWVFKTSGNVTKTAIKYYSTYVFTWCLTVLLKHTYCLSTHLLTNKLSQY
ncbi:GtrA family protein [Apilactobacillus kunkeei]|uniref:GtrA family protein n=1 Tax=Apilactobacillus kunkeei TaxID=148814 RepID=UPI002DDD313D